jgi:hypothetical protein
MVEITLDFLGQQIARVLAGQREMRLDLRSLRDEFGLLREQVRIQAATIARLDDTLTMNVLDRLRALEDR